MVAAAIALGAALAVAPATTATAQMLGPQFVRLVAGNAHTCGLQNTGQAFCWGRGGNGRLGDGGNTDRLAPVPVTMPPGVLFTELALGESHTCALGNDSKAYCWGMGWAGKLGDGTETDRSTPGPVDMPSGVTFSSISSAGLHTCALGYDNNAYCWGHNAHGQMGNGTTNESQSRPVQVTRPGGATFLQISAGSGHTCGVANDAKTYCWGMGQNGAIGNGSLSDQTTPVPVDASSGGQFRDLTSGSGHVCAFGNDNRLYCWGNNGNGQLGSGTASFESRPMPVNVPPNTSLRTISAYGHQTCSVSHENKLWCWGMVGNAEQRTPVLTDPPSGTNFYSVTAGGNHVCALANPYNNAYCWGRNYSGQLGINQTADQHSPVEVGAAQAPPGPSGTPLTQVSVGNSHMCGIDQTAKAYCWGLNQQGQLGDGTTTIRQTPTAVNAPAGVSFTQFALGSVHTCATGNDARTYCWGAGSTGALGNGSTADVPTPTPVDTPPGVTLTGLTAESGHTCGLGSNAITYCWGSNYTGELGNGTTSNGLRPMPVNAPTGVTFTQIAAGGSHTCGIGNDSRAYCWGLGTNGAMGNGSTADQLTPGPVTMPGGVAFTKITSGQNHSCAIGDDNRTYCWGFNGNYQVGNGTSANQLTPVAVVVPGGAVLTEVAASSNLTCGLGNDTRVYCWGWGWGYNMESTAPVATITMPVPFTNLSAGSALCAKGNDNLAYCWSGNDTPGVVLAGGMSTGGERMVNVIWNDQMSGALREYLAICRGCGPRAE
jgi:alpha-tubulin suppressor-like RCC1 family protein